MKAAACVRGAAGLAAAACVAAGLAAANGDAHRADARRSGTAYMTPELRAMQQDDGLNPAMLSVQDGEAAWSRKPANGERACTDCHGDAAKAMRGVAARYPRFDSASARPVTLGERIDVCIAQHQRGTPLGAESEARLALEAYVGLQSRGLPIAPDPDPRLEPFARKGARLYLQQMGQLDFSCAQCHDERAGLRLGGSTIPEAHPTGYPIYRLEWQALGSLQRRLRGCMSGVRAEPFAYGSRELVELELYLARRAAGLAVETPAVRP